MADPEGRVTLWGIEVFVASAEEGSISAAARRLGVSPSAVSQQLTALEAALGASLLDRASRPVQVTPAGAMFRRHAQTILNAASEARAELAMADLSGLTTLRLGVIEDFDSDVTPRLLTTLAQDLKGCRFLLETGASHRLMDQLEARALDIVRNQRGVRPDRRQRARDDPLRLLSPRGRERALVVGPRSIASTSPTRSLGTRRLTVWRAEWCLSKSPLAPTTSAWGPANFQQTMDTRSACGLVRHALAAATRSSVLFFTRSSSRSSTRSSTRSPLDPPLSSALDPHSMLHSIHVRPLPSYPTALRAG